MEHIKNINLTFTKCVNLHQNDTADMDVLKQLLQYLNKYENNVHIIFIFKAYRNK
jgi:hypothetical protein